MATPFDLTDVPAVSADELGEPMRLLIESGQALLLLRGPSEQVLRNVEDALWQRAEVDPARRLAVMLRFRGMIAVFSSRRLQDLLLTRGFGLIAQATAVAADMRLNTTWGFSPHKFVCALQQPVAGVEDAAPRVAADERLAA